MIKRLLSLLSYWFLLILIFIIEKPLFMLYTSGFSSDYTISDFMSVIRHGLPIDITTAGYFVLLPLLLLIISVWWQKIPYKQIMKVYSLILAILLSLGAIGDAAVYPYWGYKLDASVLFYLKTPKEALASVSVGVAVLGFVIVGILSFLIYYLLDRTQRFVFPKVKKRIPAMFVWLILMVPLFISIRGGLEESTMNVGRAYFSTDQYLNHSAVNPCFSFLSSLGKSEDYASKFDFFEEDVRAELFEGLYENGDNDTVKLLKTERPNVLVIILESFGGDFFNAISGRKDITPRLDSIARQGVFFKNCYAGSFRTDRGVVCFMNGHPGLPDVSIMKLPNKSKTLPSFPRKLEENGYSTDFLYGGDINFTNMQSYLWSNGYQHITSDVDFSLADRKTGAWGVTDCITFDYLLEQLKHKTDTLWHTAFLTLSSHEPFEVPYNRLEDKIANSFAYTDSCLGDFLDSLKQTPIWDNLLVVLTPDHGFCYPVEGNRNLPHVHHIPMIWTGGAIDHHVVIDDYVGQTDMAATILAQMGIDHSDFHFSRNVLSSDYKYPFAFYTFNNGLCFIDSTGISMMDNNSGQIILEEGEYGKENRQNRGKAILQSLMDDLGSR